MLARRLWEAVRDLLPIIVVVMGFQTLVLRQPFPNAAEMLVEPVMAAIHTAGRLDEHGTGVVFVLPVEQVAGIKEAIVRREPG